MMLGMLECFPPTALSPSVAPERSCSCRFYGPLKPGSRRVWQDHPGNRGHGKFGDLVESYFGGNLDVLLHDPRAFFSPESWCFFSAGCGLRMLEQLEQSIIAHWTVPTCCSFSQELGYIVPQFGGNVKCTWMRHVCDLRVNPVLCQSLWARFSGCMSLQVKLRGVELCVIPPWGWCTALAGVLNMEHTVLSQWAKPLLEHAVCWPCHVWLKTYDNATLQQEKIMAEKAERQKEIELRRKKRKAESLGTQPCTSESRLNFQIFWGWCMRLHCLSPQSLMIIAYHRHDVSIKDQSCLGYWTGERQDWTHESVRVRSRRRRKMRRRTLGRHFTQWSRTGNEEFCGGEVDQYLTRPVFRFPRLFFFV